MFVFVVLVVGFGLKFVLIVFVLYGFLLVFESMIVGFEDVLCDVVDVVCGMGMSGW